jgi:hypothetical protein
MKLGEVWKLSLIVSPLRSSWSIISARQIKLC